MSRLPCVQLIGDSITVGYAPLVAARLAGRIEVRPPPANAGDSANLLAHLDEWLLRAPPDLVHLNCGLHDLKRLRRDVAQPPPAADEAAHPRAGVPQDDGPCQQPIETYSANVRTILERLTAALPRRVIWASITPVIYDWHHRVKDFDRYEADVRAYNEAASAAAASLGVPINDLGAVIQSAGRERCLTSDGVHLNELGNRLLVDAVAARLTEVLKP